MQINGFNGSLPMHIANAYGVKSAASTRVPVSAPSIAQPATALTALPSTSSPMQGLVAGRVSQPIDFESSGQLRSSASVGAFQMYTRAADKIEAAVAVQIGRGLDVTA